MSDPRFERPTTTQHACALLAETPARAMILAGGTDLQLKLKDGLVNPGIVVDIKGIRELSTISWSADGELRIGAAVSVITEEKMIIIR